MKQNASQFKYVYIDNKASKTLILLHGTGGDEKDLLFLDTDLEKKYNLLGLRGNIDEQGLRRFFRRKGFGIFDQENIKEKAAKLKEFIDAWRAQHTEELTFLGYSNGANMLLATLFYYPDLIQKALFLHPMLPFDIPPDSIDLSTQALFVSYGTQDPMISLDESARVVHTLESVGAHLTIKEYPSAHGLTKEELQDIHAFLQ